MTSISEKLVSFWANVSWKFEKCDTALREVSRNTKSAQRLCAALTGRAAALSGQERGGKSNEWLSGVKFVSRFP